MADIRVLTKNTGVDLATRGYLGAWAAPGGAQVVAPWFQALVHAGVVSGFSAGAVATGIAGHAAVDADQPEIALRIPSDPIEVLPLVLKAASDSGSTTLGVHELMYAASGIDIANGTSTAYNTDGKPLNMRFDLGATTACIGRHTYSGNGTDPLTTGNFIELGRVGAVTDSDAAGAGAVQPSLLISAMNQIMPIVTMTGSIVGYGGGTTGTVYYFSIMYAEGPRGMFTA